MSILDDPEVSLDDEHVLLRSNEYVAFAADLQSKKDLQKLGSRIDLSKKPVLFLAEVSMTYMDPEAVSRVIQWASSFEGGTSIDRGHRWATLMLRKRSSCCSNNFYLTGNRTNSQ